MADKISVDDDRHYEFEKWAKNNITIDNCWLAKNKKGHYINWMGQLLYDSYVAGYNKGTYA